MDPSLLEQLQGAKISVNPWHNDNPQKMNNTTFIKIGCGKNAKDLNIDKLKEHLRDAGVTGDLYADSAGAGFSIVSRNLTPSQLAESLQGIKNAFQEVDSNIQQINLTDPIPKPSCKVPVASSGKGKSIG